MADSAISSGRAFLSLVAALGPAAVLVDERLDIVEYIGDCGPFLAAHAREVAAVRERIVPPFSFAILSAAPAAIGRRTAVHGLPHPAGPDGETHFRVTAYPVEAEDGALMALAVFEPVPAARRQGDQERHSKAALKQKVETLDSELTQTVDRLHLSSLQIDLLNEALTRSNAELHASNQRLRAANQALEEANAELQRANAALEFTNSRLNARSRELKLANESLGNILAHISLPLMVVDRQSRVTQASRAAELHFRVPQNVEGPPLSSCRLPDGYPDLEAAVGEAMESGEVQSYYVETETDDAILRIVPLWQADESIIGAVVLVSDNTKALRDARNELELLFANVPAAIMVRDEDGIIVKANPPASRLLTADGADVSGTSYYSYFSPGSAADIRDLDREILRSGIPSIGEVAELTFLDGSRRWMRVSRFPAKDPVRGEQLIYVLEQDITEQRRFELRLKASEARLEQAVRASRIGLGEWTVRDGAVYWSPRMFEILGLDPPQFAEGPPDFDTLVHEEDRPLVKSARRAHFNDRKPMSLDFRVIRSDGATIWVRSFGQASWDRLGRATNYIYTLEDITLEKQGLMELRTQKDQLQLAAHLAGIAVWSVDHLTGKVKWSDRMYEIHGTSPEEFEPSLEGVRRFYEPADHERIFGLSAGDGAPFELECRIRRPDGQERVVRAAGTPRVDRTGTVSGVFGVHRDVTREREREAQLANVLEDLARGREGSQGRR